MPDDDLQFDDEENEGAGGKPAKGKKPKKERKPKKEKKPKEPKPKKEKKPKEPKPKKEKKPKGESDGKGGILASILKGFLFLTIVGGVSAFLYFNVFGVRQSYVVPQLRRIPVVKNFIPYLEGEEPEEAVDETNPDSLLSKKQLLEKIASLEKENDDLKIQLADSQTTIDELNGRILELEVFKNEQETFKKNKEEFDIMIGRNDPEAYASFYEQIDPETAQRLYSEAVTNNALDDETKKQLAAFQQMKPAPAAALLEEMMRTDMDLVVLIMENLDAKQTADILAAMTARNATAVARRIIPR